MIVIDTNILVRLFTQDDLKKANQAKLLLESTRKLTISDVVFPELEYILRGTVYSGTRIQVLKAFHYLVSRKNVSISPEVVRATIIYEETNLDMADCIIAATSTGNTLFSFDKKLLSVKGVEKAEITNE